jgi:hypothetical protein
VIGDWRAASGANEIVRFRVSAITLRQPVPGGRSGDVLYYVSLTILSLFVGSQVVESRRWR